MAVAMRSMAWLFAVAGILAPSLAPGPVPANAAEVQGTCDIAFRGSATLHGFSGKGRCAPFAAPLTRRATGGPFLPAVLVRVPVASLDTGNASRDERMREMFEARRYPDIRGTAEGIDAEALRKAVRESPDGRATLPVFLAIRDVERLETARIVELRESGDRVVLGLEMAVSLSAYHLKPPSLLGIFRVADTVRVRGMFTLDLPRGE